MNEQGKGTLSRGAIARIMAMIWVVAGLCLATSCGDTRKSMKGTDGKHTHDANRYAHWKKDHVLVETIPTGAVVKTRDTIFREYTESGRTPALVTWCHHCTSCNDSAPVAPVVLEQNGMKLAVIPAGDHTGAEFGVSVDFTGREPVVRKGILYDPNVYAKPDVKPSYPKGDEAYQNFIFDHFYYPAPAMLKGIEGKVVATFVVEQDGSLTNLRILHGIGGGCDEEVLELIRMMPRWNPGKIGGQPVRTRMALEIAFYLGNKNHVKSVYYWK